MKHGAHAFGSRDQGVEILVRKQGEREKGEGGVLRGGMVHLARNYRIFKVSLILSQTNLAISDTPFFHC